MIHFNVAVEGMLDEAVVCRLLSLINAAPDNIYGKKGKGFILKRITGYNNSAKNYPWMVLIDLDESECAPLILKDYLPDPAPFMCLSIAVREVESWLMADRERIAKFLSVSQSIIPHDCDSIENPKEKLVDIARKSRRADIREDIVPRKGSGIKIGPAYTSRLVEFVLDETNGWRPESAARSSPSLNRCIERIVGTVNKIRTAKL